MLERLHRIESDINNVDSHAGQHMEGFRVPHHDAIPAGNPREMRPGGPIWMDIVHSKGKPDDVMIVFVQPQGTRSLRIRRSRRRGANRRWRIRQCWRT